MRLISHLNKSEIKAVEMSHFLTNGDKSIHYLQTKGNEISDETVTTLTKSMRRRVLAVLPHTKY